MGSLQNQSEVARLRQQIELEYQAMVQGLKGLTAGTARHAFIRARCAKLEDYHKALTKQMSEAEADMVVTDLYNQTVKEVR